MAQNLTIGRLGLDTAHLELIEQANHAGRDTLNISTALVGDSLAELRALRQAALGLHRNVDERVVPVTYSDDAWFDGYYRVDNVTVGSVPASLTAFWLPAELQLTRVAQYGAPAIEARVAGALRTNDHSITTSDFRAWHAPGKDTLEGYSDYFDDTRGEFLRQCADGTSDRVQLYYGGSNDRAHFTDAFPSWHMTPADYYYGAARLNLDGIPAVGRQIPNLANPSQASALGATTSWEISNGIVRMRPDTANAGNVEIELFDNTAWEEANTEFYWGWYHSSTWYQFGHPHAITVLQNTPEMVAIRLTYSGDAQGGISEDFAATVDVLLRRGANYFECYLDAAPVSAAWGARTEATTAATALSSSEGIRGTSNTSDGNRMVIASPETHTADTTNGGIYLTSAATSFPFAIGWNIRGSSATDIDGAEETAAAYHCAHYERARVVAR